MWDTFWRVVIFTALLSAVVVSCSSCSIFGGELSDEDLIEAVSDAGCNLKSIKREGGVIDRIDCLETVRHSR